MLGTLFGIANELAPLERNLYGSRPAFELPPVLGDSYLAVFLRSLCSFAAIPVPCANADVLSSHPFCASTAIPVSSVNL
jgi:hypothetical protein